MDTPTPRAKKIVKGKVGLKETAQLRLAWAPIPQPLGPGQAPHWGPICLSLLLQAPAHAVPPPGTPPPSSPLIQACGSCRPCWAGPPAALEFISSPHMHHHIPSFTYSTRVSPAPPAGGQGARSDWALLFPRPLGAGRAHSLAPLLTQGLSTRRM